MRRLVEHERQLSRYCGVQQPVKRLGAGRSRTRGQETTEHEPWRLHAGQRNRRGDRRRPGHDLTEAPASRAAATSAAPGSETPGMPASVVSASVSRPPAASAVRGGAGRRCAR